MAKSNFRRAIGLSYEGDHDSAPKVSLKGDALDADQIVALAKKYGVPIIERTELARAIDLLDQDQEIPVTLYRAVAIILAELAKEAQAK